MKKLLLVSACLSLGMFVTAQLYAQDTIVPPDSPTNAAEDVMPQPEQPAQPAAEITNRISNDIDPTTIPSLLFTYWEHTSILDAKADAAKDIGDQRAVTQYELDQAANANPAEPKPKPPPEMRELRLGGILYTAKNDWTIWLNEQRITPDALPKEIIELRVYRHHVDVKWYDDYTMRVFPIRLKSHQRFNLDSRIFLPG